MRICMVGGGSGGHVTPLRAIVENLPQETEASENFEVTIVTDRAFYDQTLFLFKNHSNVKFRKIFSGKYRRYNGKSALWHATHLPTLALNLRDLMYIGIGTLQSIRYVLLHRPDVIFCKGGYVCVPVGIAAKIFNVPLVIHDSDTHPGLTNRFLSGWARRIGTGMPSKYYSYPAKKMFYSGIPVQKEFAPISAQEQGRAKLALGLNKQKSVLLVTGGGTGAAFINKAISDIASELLSSGWQILHVVGRGKARSALSVRDSLPGAIRANWRIEEFAEMSPMVRAADLVVTRAGATAMQEFANAKKAVIVIPSPYLTGGHQLKNADMFNEQNAATVLQEADIASQSDLLFKTIDDFRAKPESYKAMAQNLYDVFAKPFAAEEIANVIVDEAIKNKK